MGRIRECVVPETYKDLMSPLYLRLGRASGPAAAQVFGASSENLDALEQAYLLANDVLAEQVLAHVYAQTPLFFERVVIDLVLALGYGDFQSSLVQHLGQSHDGGVDGVISRDPLGLDVILLQAKRLKPNSCVSVSQIRDFIGALEMKRASKGIFVTTGTFSSFAQDSLCNVSHRVRLIDGIELSRLMVANNLGTQTVKQFAIKSLDMNYFSMRHP